MLLWTYYSIISFEVLGKTATNLTRALIRAKNYTMHLRNTSIEENCAVLGYHTVSSGTEIIATGCVIILKNAVFTYFTAEA